MGSLILPELSLDSRFSSKTWVPTTAGQILAEVSRIQNVSDKISKLEVYVNRLQDEMKKIDAFKRELPLCMLLLNDAIAAINEELMQLKKSNSEPVLEEFIPLKKSCADEKDEQIENGKGNDTISSRDKMNWLSSVQLWSSSNQHHYQSTDPSNDKPSPKLDNIKKRKVEEMDRPAMNGFFQSSKNMTVRRAFVPFKESDEFLGVTGLSLCMPDIKNSRELIYSSGLSSKPSCSRSGSPSVTIAQSNFKAGQQITASRKQRRCWSPELHRRFVSALQQLGGPQVATPKQIRELMQVDGLTNDEVKSHLQKYRLHMRRAPLDTNTSAVQAVALGELYMHREKFGECAKASSSQSGSPEGPLDPLHGSSRGMSIDGMEDEDEEDEK